MDSYDRIIPPGGEGKIKLSLKTGGYGGSKMTKNISVRTNDPKRRKFSLAVTGMVEQVAKIDPKSVNMYGKPGEILEQTVTITPSQKYPFSIKSMQQLPGSKVDAELIKPEKGKGPWQVKISGMAPTVTKLYDNIVLKTDSKYTPVLYIRISIMFIDQQSSDS